MQWRSYSWKDILWLDFHSSENYLENIDTGKFVPENVPLKNPAM